VTSPAGPVYQARYGRTWKHTVSIGFGLVASAVFLPAAVPAWQKLIVVGGFGGGAVMLAALALSRPALRVDAAGVTIRPYPLRFSVIAFYPWQHVAQIRIIRFQRPAGQYVEIQLREGASWSPPSRPTSPRSRKALYFAQNSVAVNGWTLHPGRLAAAVACFAPSVQVIDAATGFVVNPDERR
jgi:hypothetical protein